MDSANTTQSAWRPLELRLSGRLACEFSFGHRLAFDVEPTTTVTEGC